MGIFSPASLPTMEQGFLGLEPSWYPQEHMAEEAASVSAGEALRLKGEDQVQVLDLLCDLGHPLPSLVWASCQNQRTQVLPGSGIPIASLCSNLRTSR